MPLIYCDSSSPLNFIYKPHACRAYKTANHRFLLVRHWKLGGSLDGYGINRIGIGFLLLQFHLWTPTQQPTQSHFPYDGEDFASLKLISPALNSLSIADVAGIFNDAQLDNGNTLSKSSTHHARSLPST